MSGKSSVTTDTALTTAVKYIIEFLLYGNKDAVAQVGYTADPAQWEKYKVVIVPNGHLGNDIIEPDMLTAECKLQNDKKHYLFDTDIIYNTFFFISRAEEIINHERDKHGRFLAGYSILGDYNRLQIPIIDEYSRLLLKALDLPMPPNRFSRVTLTHDIDTIAHYRHLRGAIGGLLRHQAQAVWASWLRLENDPAYTFPWLIEQDRQVKGAEVIYFVKHTHGRGLDYPQYNLHGRDWHKTRELLRNSGATLGTHTSCYGYNGSEGPVRAHYLNCSIDDMRKMVLAGVTDDYTMGFADQAGFRLQTTRPVRWIDPETLEVTTLLLHPLTLMDVTLSNENYMNLTEDEAYFYCQRLFDKVRLYNGELVLLWHNNNINPATYHRSLYPKLLSLI